MDKELATSRGVLTIRPWRSGRRKLTIACGLAALSLVLLAMGWFRVGWAQEEISCSPQDLGVLGEAADAQLTASRAMDNRGLRFPLSRQQ